MKIVFAPEALADLEATVEYIAERNPSAAREVGERVFAIVDQLAVGAFEGPEQVLRTGDRVSSWPVRPMRVYYEREADRLVVLRIYHQARQPL